MLNIGRKRKIQKFYDTHIGFLSWYLEKHSNISEKLHYLVVQKIAEALYEEFPKVMRLNEVQQRRWILKQVSEFTKKEREDKYGDDKKIL